MASEVEKIDMAEPLTADQANGDPLQHGRLYWLWHHTKTGVKDALRRHIFRCVFISIVVLLSVLIFRAAIQPYVLFLRTKIFVLMFGLPFVYVLWRTILFGKIWRRILAVAFATPIIFFVWQWGDEVHEYVSLYLRYKTLKIVELDEMPITDHERIQPLYSVHSAAFEATAGSNVTPMTPNFVRSSSAFDWTIGIEPKFFGPRMIGGVRKIFRAPGTAANVNFLDQDKQIEVNFPTGENSYLGYNIFTATIKTFGVVKYFNYETDRVSYLFDDQNQVVQVISLIRWKGLLFPRREFGGVQIIRQTEKNLPFSERIFLNISPFLFGAGEWVAPENVKRYPFLRGQNIVPLYSVSRYMADSFRFRKGWWGPLPWIHEGDVRIPDMEHDINPQPFTTFFQMPDTPGKLYHYFGLEPFGPQNQATILSLLIPADDASVVYVYSHEDHNDLINGVSTIPAKVMGSQKIYTWDKNWPVEQRPYVKDIGGQRRFYWLTTIVTKKEVKGEQTQLIAGVRPEIALTDGKNNEPPVWVDPTRPETWIDELKKHL